MCNTVFTVFIRIISLSDGRDDLCDLQLIWLGPGADGTKELGTADTFSSRVNLLKYSDMEVSNSGMTLSDMYI
jgi:hypothetical protein